MALGDATVAYPVTDRTVQPVTAGGGTGGSQDPLTSLLISLGMGGLDIYNIASGKPQAAGNTAANISNPLLPLQPQARTDMAAFMADPGSVLKDPGFLAAENIGAENISRVAGSRGMGGSGNRLADLFKFGQTSGQAYEQQRYGQLLGLLQGSPYAANNYLGGQQGAQGSIADLLKQLLGGAAGPGAIQQLLRMIGSGPGGGDISSLMTSGGINAGTLDPGGTLGDFQSGDFGGGSLSSDIGSGYGDISALLGGP